MKKLILLPLILFLASCASSSYYMPKSDQGVTCRPLQGETQDPEALQKKSCIGVDFGYDPVRFHYLPEWERKSLPPMPDLY